MKSFLTILALFPVALVEADKLDKALASAIFPSSSNLCQGGGGSSTSFSTTYTSTFDVSDWDDNSKAYEENVFEVDISHVDTNPDLSWTIRIGKGGQIASLRVAAGEAIANQANGVALWNDLVQQMVAVNTDLNTGATPNFIHQAGPYAKDTGMPPPFYSPKVALDCSEDYCSTVNWGQQAHVPTSFDSPLLYYTRYRDCGNGVIEYDMAMHHFGQVSSDQYKYFNTPWTGVRTSTFRDMMISNTNGQLEHTFPMGGFGPNLRQLRYTGGFTTFAEDLELSPDVEHDFGYCVDRTKELPATADVPCDSTEGDVVPFVLEVFADNSASENGLSGTYGVERTVSMRLCNLTAPVRTGRNGWGNPYDGVTLINDRTGFNFTSDFLIHPCWEDQRTYFSSSVSASELNAQFSLGDTISVEYVTSGKPVNDQRAFTFVHGTNPEFRQDWYTGRSRMRYGTTNNRRDGTVWTTNWLGKLNPSETYFSRKYMVTDTLQNSETAAQPFVGETFEDVQGLNEMEDGEIIKLWKDGDTFGASVGSESCSDSTATVACIGSSTPSRSDLLDDPDDVRPWFYITCGALRATSTDPYHMAIFEGTLKKPYLCVDETGTMTRASWKLLGFFDSTECDSIGDSEYVEDLCDDSTMPSVAPVTEAPVTEPPITSAPITDSPVTAAPVTVAPVTVAPVTAAPVTDAPVTDAPVTSAPVTEAPVTTAPVTSAPVTTAPVTEAPVTDAPVTAAPADGSPTTDCVDDPSWGIVNGNGGAVKDCDWVAENPYNNEATQQGGRCSRKGDDDTQAKDACRVACNTCLVPPPPCAPDSLEWTWENSNGALKGCEWVAEKPYQDDAKDSGRCFRRGNDIARTRAKDACLVACSSPCTGTPPPPPPPPACVDSSTWEFTNGNGATKDCGWVAEKPYQDENKDSGRCFRRGNDTDGTRAKDACLVACSSPCTGTPPPPPPPPTCVDSATWEYTNGNGVGKDCAWVAKAPYTDEAETKGRCFRSGGEDGQTLAGEACPLACGQCS